jgi:hypothetical protein
MEHPRFCVKPSFSRCNFGPGKFFGKSGYSHTYGVYAIFYDGQTGNKSRFSTRLFVYQPFTGCARKEQFDWNMRGTLNQHCFFNERDLEAGSHFGVIDSVELFQQLLKKFKLFQQLLKRFQQLLKLFQHSTKGVNIQQKGSKMGISQTTVLIQVFIGGSRRGICFIIFNK